MAGQFTDTQKTYKIKDASGVAMYHGVSRSAENEVRVPTDVNEIPVGIVSNDERLNLPFHADGSQAGRNIAVQLDGIANVILGEPIAVNERVVLGVGGVLMKATGLPKGTQANVLGFTEKGGVIGDVVPVMIAYHVYTI